ncbi:hypothetical protein SALBM217S_09841 [Streptomyces griseoloalbus]
MTGGGPNTPVTAPDEEGAPAGASAPAPDALSEAPAPVTKRPPAEGTPNSAPCALPGPAYSPTDGLLKPTGPEDAPPASPAAPVPASRLSNCTAARLTCSTRAPGSHPLVTRRAAPPSGARRLVISGGDGRAARFLSRHASTSSRMSPVSPSSSGGSCTTR